MQITFILVQTLFGKKAASETGIDVTEEVRLFFNYSLSCQTHVCSELPGKSP